MGSFQVRLLHCCYSQLTDVIAQIDNAELEYLDGYNVPDEVRQLLFSATGLAASQEHTVVSNTAQASENA